MTTTMHWLQTNSCNLLKILSLLNEEKKKKRKIKRSKFQSNHAILCMKIIRKSNEKKMSSTRKMLWVKPKLRNMRYISIASCSYRISHNNFGIYFEWVELRVESCVELSEMQVQSGNLNYKRSNYNLYEKTKIHLWMKEKEWNC